MQYKSADAISLRPYQVRAVDAVRRLMVDGAKAPLLVAPTGAGKTVILSHVVRSAVDKGRRVVIVAHRAELLQQIDRAIRAVGIEPGIIAPWARPNPFRSVQIASVQTIVRREAVGRCDLLVIDEAHHTTLDNQWGAVVDMLKPRWVLGLTATPIRTDGQGLGISAGGLYDAMEVVTSTAELVEAGYLARPVVYAPAVSVDVAGVRTTGGDYNKAGLAKVMGTGAIIGDAVAHYRKLCPGAKAVAFCVSLAHCELVADAFNDAGIVAEVIDGRLSPEDRASMLSRFAAGACSVLVSCDLIGEGFDLPSIEAAILLRPTVSTGLYLQQVGRALRPSAGKSRAVILDHAGNTLRHGMPTDEREWSLEGDDETTHRGKRKADPDAAPVWQCGQCYAYTPSKDTECEACGVPRPFLGRQVEVEAGELVEIQQAPKRVDPERKSARTLADLERLEKARGYKAGWARHVWAARMAKSR